MTVDVLRRASAGRRPDAFHVPAQTRRTRALLELDPVVDELERRADFGLGAISDRRHLELLGTLPADVPVLLSDLDSSAEAGVTSLPRGYVEIDGRYVTRRAVPPVRVISAGVCAPGWVEALRQASQFASYCTRYAAVTGSGLDRDRAMMEARFYGIGLAVMGDGPESFEWLIEPEPFSPTRQTTSSWVFAEGALEAFAHNPELAR